MKKSHFKFISFYGKYCFLVNAQRIELTTQVDVCLFVYSEFLYEPCAEEEYILFKSLAPLRFCILTVQVNLSAFVLILSMYRHVVCVVANDVNC